ncbi:MAG: hypothetical protein IPN01_28615 [Deltaproteobacteria bacterium]|nr:hypothetical protein [Deltaproteobacteria bacterium]
MVLWGLDVPLVEDGLFWWVPQGLLAAETGPQWVLDRLAQATRPHAALPPQWAGNGLPDYGHPPLWFLVDGAVSAGGRAQPLRRPPGGAALRGAVRPVLGEAQAGGRRRAAPRTGGGGDPPRRPSPQTSCAPTPISR